ncbi:hypothetical protein MMC07_002554 [Pseudocyphellaria aurata]|nr:hypothetical protein [Pseudocyphellaria aurata]
MEDSKRRPKLPIQQMVILAICRVAEPSESHHIAPAKQRLLINFRSCHDFRLPLSCECLSETNRDSDNDFPKPEMIESFHVPRKDVAKWAGITAATFSLSQAATGILWGRASDRWGRKTIILVGGICAMFSSLLFGFSNSLAMAIVGRCLAGVTYGNVGTYRTAVAEMIPEKELQPRAFSIMPLVYAMGSIFGPALGGALANPAANFPDTFGDSAFLKNYPYALPNIAASTFFAIGIITGALFLKVGYSASRSRHPDTDILEETLESKKYKRDHGRVLGRALVRAFGRAKSKMTRHADSETTPLLKDSRPPGSTERCDDATQQHNKKQRPSPPTYKEVFTHQTSMTLLVYAVLALHAVAFEQLLPVFLHYPRQEDRGSDPDVHLPFKFSGGFGINADRIGLIFTLCGICGLFIQFFVFPAVVRRFGVVPSLKITSIIFPLCYTLVPFSTLFPTPLTQQLAVFLICILQVGAVMVGFPCLGILLTNSAVSLRVLGTINGVATSVSAIGRAIGPAIEGWAFSFGLKIGYVILPWWTLAAIAALGSIPVWYLIELDGPFGDEPDNLGSVTAEPHLDTEEVTEQTQAKAMQQRQMS